MTNPNDKAGEMNKTQWAFSWDEELYDGTYDSKQEAIDEAFAQDPTAESVWVVIAVKPKPEEYFDADLVIEHIKCQDDFGTEWAEGWPDETKEQLQELTDSLQKVFSEWMDKHSLRPTFFICRHAEEVKNLSHIAELNREDGK